MLNNGLMRKIALVLVPIIVILLLFSIWGLFYFRSKKPVDCSTFKQEEPSGRVIFSYGCDVEQELGDGLTLRVVNLRDYIFLFGRLYLNLVQVKDGKVVSHWYLAKVLGKSDGILLIIKSGKSLSTDPDEQRSFLSIPALKKWLDSNSFKNKQVIAVFYTPSGKNKQYFVEMDVYQGDVKKD
jgi:hypothetical protein